MALGIPDFNLEAKYIERRVKIMKEEGIEFKTGVNVGVDVSAKDLQKEFDAIVLCGGSEKPRDLQVEGRELKGVYFAMDYLRQQNRLNRGAKIPANERITAKGKRVIVLGGGDTGADCVGTANRQGAASVKQFELLPEPPKDRSPHNPWPQWAQILRTSTSHEEGCVRDYSIMTTRLNGENGELKRLHAIRLEFNRNPETGRMDMTEVPGTEFSEDVDMVVLAMGFLSPVKEGMLEEFGVKLDQRGNVKTQGGHPDTQAGGMTSVPSVFAAGDMRRGQSLIVWAIHEGREAAKHAMQYLAPPEEQE